LPKNDFLIDEPVNVMSMVRLIISSFLKSVISKALFRVPYARCRNLHLKQKRHYSGGLGLFLHLAKKKVDSKPVLQRLKSILPNKNSEIKSNIDLFT